MEMNPLQEEIASYKKSFVTRVPENIRELMEKATKEIKASGVAPGLATGEKAPSFTLPDALGQEITLEEELKKGPVVLTFYRGAWCPYCNLELKAYQRELDQIKEVGAQLIAVSPQAPDHSLTSIEKNELTFQVLSDHQGGVAEAYKLRFALPSYLIEIYKSFGIDLPRYNGDDSWTLPVAATFVIAKDGTIRLSFVDVDYTNRLDPTEVLKSLQSLS